MRCPNCQDCELQEFALFAWLLRSQKPRAGARCVRCRHTFYVFPASPRSHEAVVDMTDFRPRADNPPSAFIDRARAPFRVRRPPTRVEAWQDITTAESPAVSDA